MPQIFADILTMPKAGMLVAAASSGALIFALILQYGFDVQPCILCFWQRLPFVVAAALASVAVFRRPYMRILMGLCAAVFLVGAALAVFHTGVELHWWLGTSGCAIQPLHGASPESLRLQLLHTVVARCDQITWTLLGLSMANWNVPFSLGLAGFSLAAALRRK